MILITGDTHGYIDFNKLKTLPMKIKDLTYNDYVIIAGDFGGVWSEKTLEQDLYHYKKLPFTVLFVDGNHENFELLNSYEVEYWNGGKIHRIAKNIIHLMRGQVFEIDGKTIFTFGGAISVDRVYRKEHISWWKEEMPTEEDLEEAKRNLERYNNDVDYIITHTCDTSVFKDPAIYYFGNKFEIFSDNKMLDYFEQNVKYKHWYFGHYHFDYHFHDKKTVLYNMVVEI